MACWWGFPLAYAAATNDTEAPMCQQTPVQEQLHYLRRLSLDLRGHLPSVAEYEFVAQSGQVSAQQIEEMLASEEFVGRMRRYHRDLLWVNIGAQRLSNNQWRLTGDGRSNGLWIGANNRATRFRGARANCGDFESSTTNGRIDTRPHPNAELAAEGVVQEGWVWVQPYWNPDQPVKVCAFDAQEACRAPTKPTAALLRFPAIPA